ncbi:MAG TPA: cobyric acid synthase [Bryobacteraceae bacterium]|nr:cobyric acid synthase [Bryobacteraceae bacterium]
MAQSLFIGGTASHVGKSWFTAAFCRLLANRGVRVAPFKAQNMSNNSYPCIEGGEIGRSQAMQAEACGLPAMADMNPVLLKPNSSTGSQVVVRGKVWKSVEAIDYYRHTEHLFEMALESHRRLAKQFDSIVCEGAGSVAEVNLFDRDITNLRLAERVGAGALLVADIERGGVFASLVGTLELLPTKQRALVRAFAVNRFRGDRALFDRGVEILEGRLGVPCLGVFPWTREIVLDEEDSLGIDEAAEGDGSVAVVRLPHISNFTDFHAIGPVSWISKPGATQYRVVFLPGTKNTIEDLRWLREQGLDEWLRQQHGGGALIVGICGGYQMLGERVDDPDEIESSAGGVNGLGWLPVRTVLESPKVTRTVEARTPTGKHFRAYEIHMGRTEVARGAEPFAMLGDGTADGCRGVRVIGTYLHGAFDDTEVVEETLGLTVGPSNKDTMYDRLSEWLVRYSKPQVLEALLT